MNLAARDLEILSRKVPLFKGASVAQVGAVLRLGKVVEHPQGTVLCRDGDVSDHMFILLVGSLVVHSGDVRLSGIEAVDIVGEMGMITGMPRSATVEVSADARLIRLNKDAIASLVEGEPVLAALLFRNMLELLSQRLRDNNINLVKTRLLADADADESAWI